MKEYIGYDARKGKKDNHNLLYIKFASPLNIFLLCVYFRSNANLSNTYKL